MRSISGDGRGMVAIKSEALPFLICNTNEANYLLAPIWHRLQVQRMKGVGNISMLITSQEGQDNELPESNKISQEIQIYVARHLFECLV